MPAPDLTRLRRAVRRTVLARRRPLAALCAAGAVATGLHAVRPAPPATTPVPVARHDLPAGATVEQRDVRVIEMPEDQAPAGVVRHPAGAVLAAPLRAGEVVTDVRLVGPSLTAGQVGLVAVPVRLPDADQVALLEPGDRIDLVGADPQGGDPALVAAGLPVLAVPPASQDAGDGLSGRLVVLAADPGEVPAIAQAAVSRFLTYSFAQDPMH